MLPVQCRMAQAALGLSVKKLAVAARVAPGREVLGVQKADCAIELPTHRIEFADTCHISWDITLSPFNAAMSSSGRRSHSPSALYGTGVSYEAAIDQLFKTHAVV